MKEKPCLTNLPRKPNLVPGQRQSLPSQRKQREGYSIWEIIKPNLGKDFSRFTVPVFLNEPLCFLQRLAENMQYCELLEKAAAEADPIDRIAYVGAFAISAVSSNWNRMSKPFNPMLLETFEWERNGFRFVAEQVSHHPPVSAIHAEGPSFVIEATVSPKMSVGMNKLICTPSANFLVTFKKTGETYAYEGPTCSIYNVMLGKMYMNLTGKMHIRSSSGLELVLSFDAGRGWSVKNTDVHVDGYILEGKTKLRAIYGNWMYFLAMCDVDTFKYHHSSWQKLFPESLQPGNEQSAPLIPNSEILWTASEMLKDYEKQYNFTYFTLSLNERNKKLVERLPPTDSRLRPDIRELENGREDEAERTKHKLEDGQRARRKEGVGQIARWFEKSEDRWVFTGEYWQRDWSQCENIFQLKTNSNSATDND